MLATQERAERAGLLAALGLGEQTGASRSRRTGGAWRSQRPPGHGARRSPEAISPVALRAPSATASEEEPDNPFREDLQQ